MSKQITITTEYFRQYRHKLGFTNQTNVKNFFGAKDITPTVDFNYINLLNERLYDIVDKLNSVVVDNIKIKDLDAFKKEYIDRLYGIMKKENIIPRLNNLRRRPEQVYFSWMQGYIISCYFSRVISWIFDVNLSAVKFVGDDNLRDVKTFKKTAKADLEVTLKSKEKIIVEIQSGFTGTNDIKQHKVLEAKKIFEITGKHTIAIHFDLYNGQVAFIKLDSIKDNDVRWITRQQMEGQTVFNIDQNYFIWKITEKPMKYKEINFE